MRTFKFSILLLSGLLLTACSGISVQLGDMEPLPGIDEWINPEAPIAVKVVSYRRDCGTTDEETEVTLMPQAAQVRAWQTERRRALIGEDDVLPEGAYALIELGQRTNPGDGFAVSSAGGRRGHTALIRFTGLSLSVPQESEAEGPIAPCALVALPPGEWRRVRVLDQVSGMKATSAPLP